MIRQIVQYVDGKLQENKNTMHTWKGVVNENLKLMIKEEGLFCVEWCVIMSESMCTTLLMLSCDILLYP